MDLNALDIKNKLIIDIIKELTDVNEDREFHEQNKLNIPFMISALDKYLVTEFQGFLEDIHKRGYHLNGFTDGDNSYISGYVNILVFEKEYLNNIAKDEYFYNGDSEWMHYDYTYQIEFESINDTCESWLKPCITISKIEIIKRKSWSDGEEAYNFFHEQFTEKLLSEKDLERIKKETHKKEISEQIDKLTKELSKL